MADQGDIDRRGFLLAGIFGMWGIIGASLGVSSLRYLLFPPKAKKEEPWVKAATLAELTVNRPEKVSFHRNRADAWEIASEKTTAWIVKQSDNRAVAFAPQCTHLGCAYKWDESKSNFVCPCHSSVFSIDGNVLSGPAPRQLDRYAVLVESGDLLIGPLEPGQKG